MLQKYIEEKYNKARPVNLFQKGNNSNINIKTKMKVCSIAPLSKNSHHAEASQLILIQYQTGIHMTHDSLKGAAVHTLKSLAVKNC